MSNAESIRSKSKKTSILTKITMIEKLTSDYHELVLRHVGGGAAADRVLL